MNDNLRPIIRAAVVAGTLALGPAAQAQRAIELALPATPVAGAAGAAGAVAPSMGALRLPAPVAAATVAPVRRARMDWVAGGVIRAFWTGASESEVAAAEREAAPARRADLAAPKLEQHLVVDESGIEHQVSHVPGAPHESLARAAIRTLRELPEKARRIRRFGRRVDEILRAVTDGDLAWSFNRLEAMSSQEGILRSNNSDLVNKWTDGERLKDAGPQDFAESSLEPASLMKMFKGTMDMEEPTLQYQYAFAQSLHNRMPRMSHFLGITFQERLLQVALKGKPAYTSIWAREEVRHGPILEKVYNQTRFPGFAKLTQSGEAPRLPREGTDYAARSGMSNRALAEVGAAGAYLMLKANAKTGSPTDKVLEGVFRDEIYHHVIMSAVNRFTLGHESRLKRLWLIFRHNLDYRPHHPNDYVRHRRRGFSPLMMLEYGWAINEVDRRVNRFLDTLDPGEARRIIGPYYKTEAEVQAAVDRGEHSWTKLFPMEVNPALSKADVERLEKRMPRNFSLERRAVKASDIRAVLDSYRKTSLMNPEYWLRKKGFRKEPGSSGRRIDLIRDLPGSPGVRLVVTFERGRRTWVGVTEGWKTLWWSTLEEMSLLQLGALMDAESVAVVDRLKAAPPELSYRELLDRVARDPIPLIEDR
ncbi:MAG: hypothetical protein HY553_13050 [Elusimicrobia bacterium]|nr:hypothetical protein [Elusimicrobiota bacterium]